MGGMGSSFGSRCRGMEVRSSGPMGRAYRFTRTLGSRRSGASTRCFCWCLIASAALRHTQNCRSELAREPLGKELNALCRFGFGGSAPPQRAHGSLVSPPRASPFCQTSDSRPHKRDQKVSPLHPAFRFAKSTLGSSEFQGPAAKGHPWPIAALATSMSLNP